MKKALLLLYVLLGSRYTMAQTDHNGNPVFNSVMLKEDQFKGWKLVSNYYTLDNNINTKTSSVYISAKPTPDEVLDAATHLPSDFFIVQVGESINYLVMPMQQPSPKMIVIDPSDGSGKEYSNSLTGDITENRAKEIVDKHLIPNARIANGQLIVATRKFAIITNDATSKAVIALIYKQRLDTAKANINLQLMSASQIRDIILAESIDNGKLDYFTPIKGNEMDGVLVGKVFMTKREIALYKWGRSNYEMGVNTAADALDIFETFKGRKPNDNEKKLITMGFNKELEKE